MPSRRRKVERVQQGKYKGQRVEDAEDAIWAIGYILPRLPGKRFGTLKEIAIAKISERHLNIEKLPTVLRWVVNLFHNKYGVGRVTDARYYNRCCSLHQEGQQKYCRQCGLREEAWELKMQGVMGVHIDKGLLVRRDFKIPEIRYEDSKREKEGRLGKKTEEVVENGGDDVE